MVSSSGIVSSFLTLLLCHYQLGSVTSSPLWDDHFQGQVDEWSAARKAAGAAYVKTGFSDTLEAWVVSQDENRMPLELMFIYASSSITACNRLYEDVVMLGTRLNGLMHAHRTIATGDSSIYRCSCRLDKNKAVKRVAHAGPDASVDDTVYRIAMAIDYHESTRSLYTDRWEIECPTDLYAIQRDDFVRCEQDPSPKKNRSDVSWRHDPYETLVFPEDVLSVFLSSAATGANRGSGEASHP